MAKKSKFKGLSLSNYIDSKKVAKKSEEFLYEMRPFSLVIIALYSITWPNHVVMQIAGVVLLGCAAVIGKMRLTHRGYLKF